MAGRTINLVCTINATNPPIYYDVPTLSWLFGGKALVNTSTVTALNSKAFSYLSILNAQPNNRLVYSCSNGARTVTTNVTVLSKYQDCLGVCLSGHDREGTEADGTCSGSSMGSWAALYASDNISTAMFWWLAQLVESLRRWVWSSQRCRVSQCRRESKRHSQALEFLEIIYSKCERCGQSLPWWVTSV